MSNKVNDILMEMIVDGNVTIVKSQPFDSLIYYAQGDKKVIKRLKKAQRRLTK
jgi:hypothetical protein